MCKKSSKLLSVLLSAMMVVTALMPVWSSAATSGTDYDNHWAKSAIIKALDAGILKGYPDGSIKPDQLMTRAEFFSMVNTGFGFHEEANISFIDMNPSAWYASVLAKAYSAGYLATIDGYARPNDYITREEVAVYLCSIKYLGAANTTNSLSDLDKATPEGKDSIMSILDSKIMQGTPNLTFMPKAQIKRSEALTALTNAMAYVVTDVTYSKVGSYGSVNQNATVNGNVTVTSGDITLKNMIINGNLTIDKEVNEGTVTLNNVTIKGNTYINGGGVNSIYFVNVNADNVYASKTEDAVRIVASGTSDIKNVFASSGIRLVETAMTGAGFGNIIVQNPVVSHMQISLIGVTASNVQVKAPGVTLISDATSSIGTVTIEAANTIVQGQGLISLADLKVSGTTFEKSPSKITLAVGVSQPQIVSPK